MGTQLHAIRASVSAWLEGRAPRERVLLLVGSAVALAALLYSVLWEPAYSGRAQVVASLPALATQLAQARVGLAEARRLRVAVAAPVARGVALRDALAASLSQAGIADAHVALVGAGVEVEAKAVPFAAWMTWLDAVRRAQRVRVVDAHASADARPGLATVSAALQPTAP